MLNRRPFQALVLAVTALLFATPAWAQPAPPPTVKDLSPARPWTFVVGKALVLMAVVMTALLVVGYLVKAREFRANVRRGGSK